MKTFLWHFSSDIIPDVDGINVSKGNSYITESWGALCLLDQ
jgi:hypothetical protein